MVEFARKEKTILYAHNGGRFDFHFLLDHINSGDEVTRINGRIAKARMGSAELRDSFCLFPDKLSAWKKDEIDYDKFERGIRDKHFAEIVKYLEGDCYYLHQLIEGFWENYGPHLTLAGAALNYWANNFNFKNKPKMAESAEGQTAYYQRWAPWYFGGRVQVFEPGYHKGKIGSYDINSAYPAAMCLDHPAGPFAFASSLKGPGLERKLISLDCKSQGYFAQRKKTGGIEFPMDGEIRTFNVTGWEFIAASELGMVPTKIHAVWEFGQRRNFTDYVDHFWKMKAAAEKGSSERLWAKLFLNGLYGKFSANPENYDRTFLVDFDDSWKFAKKTRGIVAGTVGARAMISAPLLPHQIRYYDVVTGLSITGCVRAKLMKAIFGHRTLYCDTDNIKQIGPVSLPIGKKLGDWESEGVYSEAVFVGPKLYGMKGAGEFKFASKGVSLPVDAKSKELGHRAWNVMRDLEAGNEYVSIKEAPSFSLGRGPRVIRRVVKRTV